ncbi:MULTISPECIES: hypothetical protein [Streptomyces]|nr:hypothetical protein [Streptomyces virginiae]
MSIEPSGVSPSAPTRVESRCGTAGGPRRAEAARTPGARTGSAARTVTP